MTAAQNTPYPTRAEVTGDWTDKDWTAALDNIKGTYYDTPPVLAELKTSNVSTEVLHAWAYLAEALQDLYPGAKVTGTSVSRPMTDEELRDQAAAKACADEYSRRVKLQEAAQK
jgi:hypothetical protein